MDPSACDGVTVLKDQCVADNLMSLTANRLFLRHPVTAVYLCRCIESKFSEDGKAWSPFLCHPQGQTVMWRLSFITDSLSTDDVKLAWSFTETMTLDLETLQPDCMVLVLLNSRVSVLDQNLLSRTR